MYLYCNSFLFLLMFTHFWPLTRLSPGQQVLSAPMNLLCHWCGVSFSEVPWARTFFPCDHKLCRPCYYHERQPRMCFLCPPKPVMSASKGGLPEIHNRHPQPPPPTPKSLNVNLLPDTCSVNATHPSTSEDHTTSMTGFRSSAHKEDSRQSTDDSGDTNQRLSNAQVSI